MQRLFCPRPSEVNNKNGSNDVTSDWTGLTTLRHWYLITGGPAGKQSTTDCPVISRMTILPDVKGGVIAYRRRDYFGPTSASVTLFLCNELMQVDIIFSRAMTKSHGKLSLEIAS